MTSSQLASLVGTAVPKPTGMTGGGMGVRAIWWFVKIGTLAPHSFKNVFRLKKKKKALPLRQKEEPICLQRGKKTSYQRMEDNIANISLRTLMNENIHIFLWFYAWLWSVSRGRNERDKHCGRTVALTLQITVFMMVLYSSYISL